MIKRFVIAMTLAATCAFPVTTHAQAQTGDTHVMGADTRQLDSAKRAWLGQAMGHILGEDGGSGDEAGLRGGAGGPTHADDD